MAAAGYDPRDMANVFKTIQQESGSGAPQWMSSHPDPGNRYEYINQEAQRLQGRGQAAPRHARSSRTRRRTCARCRRPRPPRKSRGTGTRAGPTRQRARPARARPATSRVPTRAITTYNEGNLFRVSVPSNWRELGQQQHRDVRAGWRLRHVNGQNVFTHGVQIGVSRNENHDLQTATDELIAGAAAEQPAPEPPGQLRARHDRRPPGAAHRPVERLGRDRRPGSHRPLHDAAERRLAVLRRSASPRARSTTSTGNRVPQVVVISSDQVQRAIAASSGRTGRHRRRRHVRPAAQEPRRGSDGRAGPPDHQGPPGRDRPRARGQRLQPRQDRRIPRSLHADLGPARSARAHLFLSRATTTTGPPRRRPTSSTSASSAPARRSAATSACRCPRPAGICCRSTARSNRTRTRRSCSGCARIWRQRRFKPILAIWHRPRWGSGAHRDSKKPRWFWNEMYAARAELILNGHAHHYERFAPQRPDQIPDPQGPAHVHRRHRRPQARPAGPRTRRTASTRGSTSSAC